MMKKLIALAVVKKLVLAGLLLAFATPAQASDTQALATEVAKSMPLEQQIVDFTDTIAKNLPEKKRDVFKSVMKKNIDIKVLRASATAALQKTYTPAELKVLADFYAKPEAAVIMRKMTDFSNVMQPTIQDMVNKAITDAQKAGVFTP